GGANGKGPPGGNGQGRGGPGPGGDFDRRGPAWDQILTPHGWAAVREGGAVTYWRRPGKDGPGISATTGYCKGQDGADLLAVFSSNAHPFEGPSGDSPCRCYGNFAAYALLNHGGDFKAAARDLARQGYGEQRQDRNGRPRPPSGGRNAAGQEVTDVCPVITITTDEHQVNDEAVAALARDPGV